MHPPWLKIVFALYPTATHVRMDQNVDPKQWDEGRKLTKSWIDFKSRSVIPKNSGCVSKLGSQEKLGSQKKNGNCDENI